TVKMRGVSQSQEPGHLSRRWRNIAARVLLIYQCPEAAVFIKALCSKMPAHLASGTHRLRISICVSVKTGKPLLNSKRADSDNNRSGNLRLQIPCSWQFVQALYRLQKCQTSPCLLTLLFFLTSWPDDFRLPTGSH